MARTSKIEWTDATWNPVAGCKDVHNGCANCYAKGETHRFAQHPNDKVASKYRGLTTKRDGTVRWTGAFRPWPGHLGKPLSWKTGRKVFVNSMSDLFGAPDEYIAAVFGVMAATPRHKYVVLTKRPSRALEWFAWLGRMEGRMRSIYPADHLAWVRGEILRRAFGRQIDNPLSAGRLGNSIVLQDWPLPNVAIGVSVSDQRSWNEFVPVLLQIPARWRIVSAEPLLGPIHAQLLDGSQWDAAAMYNPLRGHSWWPNGDTGISGPAIDQVIIGAESGPGRRPCKLEWIQNLAQQVLEAQSWDVEWGRRTLAMGPALFVKQADVCEECHGRGVLRLPGHAPGCLRCGDDDAGVGTGETGTVRKGCPAVYVPGHGTQSWHQYPDGW